jgi:putative glutathione S-transferase
MTMTGIVAQEMKDGRFVRQPNRFTGRIGGDRFPAEAGRYRLYASLACPWAHRSLIVRKLLGLEDTIGLTVVDPIRDERGWRFTRFQRPDAPDLYPAELRAEIDELGDEVFHNVNNGVYKAGMAGTQDAYEEAFDALFATLDRLEARLDSRDFLVGDRLTEADVRLYPTLARFDAVYYGHFKCNLRRIIDYPRLWAYARRLYAIPAFGETTDFDHIKRHYYGTHRHLNPSGVVPKGPHISWT